MTKNEAIQIFKSKYPEREINAVGDEGRHFIIDAPDPATDQEVDPYFAVDKTTKKITHYVPEDIFQFVAMMGY